MTVAKLTPTPPQGSGLVPMLVDEHYEDLVRGRPGRLVAARVLLQPTGTSQRVTSDGVHRTVTYTVVRLEPVREKNEADNVAWEISHSYETRTSAGGKQMSLLNSPAEQRESLIEACFEWASENDVSQEELDARFTDHFGGREHANAETVRAGGLVQLMEFARYIGAVKDPVVGKEDEDPDDDGAEPADPDEDLDGDPAAEAEAKPAKAGKGKAKLVAAPPFEPGTGA